MTQYDSNIYSILNTMYRTIYRTTHHTENQATHRRSLFALPPSLLRIIIQRSQLSQTTTASPTIPATPIPLSNETLEE